MTKLLEALLDKIAEEVANIAKESLNDLMDQPPSAELICDYLDALNIEDEVRDRIYKLMGEEVPE